MWINSQIGRKNMTGKLQKRINSNFFLTLISTAFDAPHVLFQADKKRFTVPVHHRARKCEYPKNKKEMRDVFV
jgi:hypothetical protein